MSNVLIDIMIGDTRKIVDYDWQRDEYRVRADRGELTASMPAPTREDIDRAFAACRRAILAHIKKL